MTTIAEIYMHFGYEIIKNLQDENKYHIEALNKDILKHWSHRNPDDQVKVREF